jgi:hypothetical protein
MHCIRILRNKRNKCNETSQSTSSTDVPAPLHRSWLLLFGAVLADRLEFAPRVGAPLARLFVKWFFERRHAALRRRFGAA